MGEEGNDKKWKMGKIEKRVGIVLVVLFILCSSVLTYDHFKYKGVEPPKTFKKAVNVIQGILIGVIALLCFYVIRYVHKKHGGVESGLTAVVVYLILCLCYWAYYHFILRPKYKVDELDNNLDKIPKWQRTLHSIAMWSCIAVIVAIVFGSCVLNPNQCILIALLAS